MLPDDHAEPVIGDYTTTEEDYLIYIVQDDDKNSLRELAIDFLAKTLIKQMPLHPKS
ncbi:hypothetical protein [Paenibacillus ginsengarvi]|uniref:hypothetical protein n=1 Tax=Paenibacillus ginsengarvi TaxID=400777 RepID=UPI001315364C|nr:hypothetical protein [Paenibacillus ginsengarvi]